jgi:hypothetical protein
MRAILIFIAIIFILPSCGNKQENKEVDTNDSIPEKIVSIGTPDTQTETAVEDNEQDGNFLNLPKKLDEESNRYIDDKNMLYIDLLDAKVTRDKENDLLQKLFPDAIITLVSKDDAYDSFNIVYLEKPYNAIIMHEQENKKMVLSFIVISKGEFKTETLELLFS